MARWAPPARLRRFTAWGRHCSSRGSRLRANLTATVLLVLLAGIGGGVVMASIAGIRRADAAWTAFQEENPLGDAGVVILGPEGAPLPSTEDDLQDEVDAVAALDDVAAVSRATAAVGIVDDPGGTSFPIAANVYLDDPTPALIGRPVIVDGAFPDPDAADEVAIDELLADRLDVGVGDRMTLTPFLYDELEEASDGRDVDPAGRTTDLRITGIVRQAVDLLPPRTDQFALYADEPFALLTPGWWRANGPDVGNYGIFMLVDLAPDVELAEFEASMAERFGESAFVIPGIEEVGVPTEVQRAVDRQIDAEGRAVAAFGVAVALVALGLLVLALARQLAGEGADRDGLLALGVTTRSLLLVSVLRSSVVALGSGIVAFSVAVALSTRLPVGVGRRTLRDPGLDVDEAVLVLGSLVVLVAVVTLVAVVGWRIDRRSPERRPRYCVRQPVGHRGCPADRDGGRPPRARPLDRRPPGSHRDRRRGGGGCRHRRGRRARDKPSPSAVRSGRAGAGVGRLRGKLRVPRGARERADSHRRHRRDRCGRRRDGGSRDDRGTPRDGGRLRSLSK